MSGEWIKMRGNLGDDPSVIAIAAALRINADEVVGKLHRLWWWADQNTADGVIPWVSGVWIDEHVRKRGFAAAMQKMGWLVIGDDSIKFPHFDRHNGQSAKNRALDQRYKDDQRKDGKREHIPKQDRHLSGNCPVHDRTETGNETGQQPDDNRTRRREEEDLKHRVASQPVRLTPDGAPETADKKAKVNGHDKPPRGQAFADDARAILLFLNDRAGKHFPPTDSNIGIIVARLKEKFTPAQLRQVVAMKVREWKTDPEMVKFLRPDTLFNRTKFSNYVGELIEIPDEVDDAA